MDSIKENQTFYARVPFSAPNVIKVHICKVIPSFCYSDKTLIIYKVFGKHKRWWHEFMCSKQEMELYINIAQKK